MKAKKIARRSGKRRDIVRASRMAIQLAKRLKSSNNIAKKESEHPAILDELKYIGRQLRLMNLFSCAAVRSIAVRWFRELTSADGRSFWGCGFRRGALVV